MIDDLSPTKETAKKEQYMEEMIMYIHKGESAYSKMLRDKIDEALTDREQMGLIRVVKK